MTPLQMKKKHKEILATGRVLTIDPSCGSTGSLPGYAIYVAGVLMKSGTLDISRDGDLFFRLRELAQALQHLGDFDALVYEEIAPRRFGGGSAHGHASLLKAVGVTLACSRYKYFAVGIRPSIWTRHKLKSYRKGDEQDAIEMGRIVIGYAMGEIELSKADAAKNAKRSKKK